MTPYRGFVTARATLAASRRTAAAVNSVARHGEHCIDRATKRPACGDPVGHAKVTEA